LIGAVADSTGSRSVHDECMNSDWVGDFLEVGICLLFVALLVRAVVVGT
jgi:hypothetical protein